jgi:L-rhamnose mutarotase
MLVEYEPFEPALCHTDLADWGMSLLMGAAAPRAKVLVDKGRGRRLVRGIPTIGARPGKRDCEDLMKRVCFVLQVKPDRLEEYKQRHRGVWPEMQAALRETGWNNYSLFLRPDGLLVGYLETADFDRARAEMAKRKVNERWQREMAGFFVQPDGILPDRVMVPLEEVFHLQ